MATTVGIIGQGFVGSAIKNTLSKYYSVHTYDIDRSKSTSSIEETLLDSEIVFVCVPTPMRKDGSCDTRILESVFENSYEIIKSADPEPKHSDFVKRQKTKKVFVIKSTVPPGTTERISAKYPRLNVCFSPEFLTEANSDADFANQTRIIIGGEGAKSVKTMFRRPFPNAAIVVTKSETAEMVKYFTNCFLATKVTFANQMYEICAKTGIDYDKVCEYALYDPRIGKSHLAVPGPDGDLGFGGHCFPKDLAAMISFANNSGSSDYFLKAVEIFNRSVRTNKDWEQMIGRAVSDD